MQKYLTLWLINCNQKSKEINWGEAQQKSFEKLKVALAATPILDIVYPNESFVLETNVSGEAIRAILMQGGHPVAVESKTLGRMQWNYLAYEQELLVIIQAFKKWCHYLYGTTSEV